MIIFQISNLYVCPSTIDHSLPKQSYSFVDTTHHRHLRGIVLQNVLACFVRSEGHSCCCHTLQCRRDYTSIQSFQTLALKCDFQTLCYRCELLRCYIEIISKNSNLHFFLDSVKWKYHELTKTTSHGSTCPVIYNIH